MANSCMRIMLTRINHHRIADENPNEISLQTCRNGYHQEDMREQVLTGIWRKGNLGTLLCTKDCKLVQSLGKTVQKFFKTLKNRTTIKSSNPTLGYILKENENRLLKTGYAFLCLLQHYSQ